MAKRPSAITEPQNDLPKTRRWATTQDAAIHATCGQRTIQRMIADGFLPAYRVNARLVRVDLNELDDVIEGRALPSGRTGVKGVHA